MTGLVRKATLLVGGGLLIAGVVMAGEPSPGNSTIPPCIVIVDGLFDQPDYVLGSTCFVINDINGDPVPNAEVALVFNTCAPDAIVEECDAQGDPPTGDPGVLFGPGAETITYTTNILGELCVKVLGTGPNITPSAAGRPTCCQVLANGTPMGTLTVTVNTFDMNGGGAMDPGDGALVISDILPPIPGTYNSRTDYNCDGLVDFTDGALFIPAFFAWNVGLPCTLLRPQP